MLTYSKHSRAQYVPQPRWSPLTNLQSTINSVLEPEDEDLAILRRSIRLVVASSDEGLCRVIRSFLQHLGFTVFVCTSADRAERIFINNCSIDLWLIDVEQLGIEAMQLAFRVRDLYQDTPIVLISTLNYDDDPLLRPLCQSFIRVRKPLRLEELVAVIDHSLSTISCEQKTATNDFSELPGSRRFPYPMD